jgi:hypothetical protein
MANNPNKTNYYINQKIDENENSSLFKIDFRTLISISNIWHHNRQPNSENVDKLYENIRTNNINWTLTAICEKGKDDIHIIDGQHRLEAIKKIIDEDIDMKINKYVYVNIYYVDNIIKDFQIINELFIKINTNSPLKQDDYPLNFTANLIEEIIKDPVLSKGISINPKTHVAYQPMIHRKTLNEIFNQHHSTLNKFTNSVIIENFKIANNKLSTMTFEEIYFNCSVGDTDRNAHTKAKENGFFLGLKNCNKKFRLISIIDNIADINKLFKD